MHKARDLPELGHDTDGGNLRDVAQPVQSVKDRRIWQARRQYAWDRLLELFSVQIVDERCLLGQLVTVRLLHHCSCDRIMSVLAAPSLLDRPFIGSGVGTIISHLMSSLVSCQYGT